MTTPGTPRVIEWAGSGIAAAYAGWMLAGFGAEVVRLGDLDMHGEDPLTLARASLDAGKSARPATQWEQELSEADILLVDDHTALEVIAGPIEALAERFPRLVIGIHSIFGLEGPYAHLPATALDAQAIASVAWSLGDPARAPLSIPPGILEQQGGAVLAAGCLVALAARDRDGRGQLVDVALADVMASYVGGNCRFYIHHGMHWRRSGQRASDSGGAYPFVILPCADGEVCLCGRSRAEWQRLLAVMGNPEWASTPRYQSLRAMGRDYPDEVDALIRPWLAQHTMAELEKLALENNLIVAPLRSLPEVLETPHYRESGFISKAEVGTRELALPQRPYRVTEARDEDAPDIAGELLKGADRPGEPDVQPLAGIKVLDFGWVWSAPWVGTMLGELGAEVIKVEHGGRPDTLRLSGKVWRDGKVVEGTTTEMSPMYHQVNHGKLGITLNAKNSEAVALIDELVARADLVVENMSPGSLERSGLGYERFRKINPRIVMLAMSAAGQFGALSAMRAYAPTMSSFAGLEALVGYPGEEPIGALNFALGDPNASVHALAPVLAALRRARALDRGCYVDLSQTAALAGTLRAWMIAAQLGDGQPPLLGNRHPNFAPHGIFPAAGEDRWLSIAVTDEAAWSALAEQADWARAPRFSDNSARLVNIEELESELSAWTAGQDRDALVAALRSIGIASSPVLDIEEMWRDPHLAARGLKAPIEIPDYGVEEVFRAPWRFSRATVQIGRRGPLQGEHNEAVFGGILGLEPMEIDRLAKAGAIA